MGQNLQKDGIVRTSVGHFSCLVCRVPSDWPLFPLPLGRRGGSIDDFTFKFFFAGGLIVAMLTAFHSIIFPSFRGVSNCSIPCPLIVYAHCCDACDRMITYYVMRCWCSFLFPCLWWCCATLIRGWGRGHAYHCSIFERVLIYTVGRGSERSAWVGQL